MYICIYVWGSGCGLAVRGNTHTHTIYIAIERSYSSGTDWYDNQSIL